MKRIVFFSYCSKLVLEKQCCQPSYQTKLPLPALSYHIYYIPIPLKSYMVMNVEVMGQDSPPYVGLLNATPRVSLRGRRHPPLTAPPPRMRHPRRPRPTPPPGHLINNMCHTNQCVCRGLVIVVYWRWAPCVADHGPNLRKTDQRIVLRRKSTNNLPFYFPPSADDEFN